MTSGCSPIAFFEVAHGTHNAALVGVREIFIRALLCGAAGIVLVHNHPGGCLNPSEEDLCVTDKVRAASEFLGIQLYDHIIVGQGSWFSFAKEGTLAFVLQNIEGKENPKWMLKGGGILPVKMWKTGMTKKNGILGGSRC